MMSDIAGYRIEVHVNPAFVRANEVLTLTGSNARLAQVIGRVEPTPLVDTCAGCTRREWCAMSAWERP
jgi:ribulose 1,5-bisphosphate synthetase/thiazole synthase